MKLHRCAALLVAAGLAGCSEPTPTSPAPAIASPSPSPAPPPVATFAVSGTLYMSSYGVARPIAGRTVSLWVQVQTGPGRFSGWSTSSLTDGNGRYVVSVPQSTVYASAWSNAEAQPCLAAASVRGDTTLDVEIFPEANIGPTLLLPGGPVVTGTVYKSIEGGRQPIQGAELWLDASVDAWVGYTRTDAAGRFSLCRVNAPVRMDVYSDGNEVAWRSLAGSGDMTVDIDIGR